MVSSTRPTKNYRIHPTGLKPRPASNRPTITPTWGPQGRNVLFHRPTTTTTWDSFTEVYTTTQGIQGVTPTPLAPTREDSRPQRAAFSLDPTSPASQPPPPAGRRVPAACPSRTSRPATLRPGQHSRPPRLPSQPSGGPSARRAPGSPPPRIPFRATTPLRARKYTPQTLTSAPRNALEAQRGPGHVWRAARGCRPLAAPRPSRRRGRAQTRTRPTPALPALPALPPRALLRRRAPQRRARGRQGVECPAGATRGQRRPGTRAGHEGSAPGHGGRRSSPSAVSHHHLPLGRPCPARPPAAPPPRPRPYLSPRRPPGCCSRPREEQMARNRAQRGGLRRRAAAEHVGRPRPTLAREFERERGSRAARPPSSPTKGRLRWRPSSGNYISAAGASPADGPRLSGGKFQRGNESHAD